MNPNAAASFLAQAATADRSIAANFARFCLRKGIDAERVELIRSQPLVGSIRYTWAAGAVTVDATDWYGRNATALTLARTNIDYTPPTIPTTRRYFFDRFGFFAAAAVNVNVQATQGILSAIQETALSYRLGNQNQQDWGAIQPWFLGQPTVQMLASTIALDTVQPVVVGPAVTEFHEYPEPMDVSAGVKFSAIADININGIAVGALIDGLRLDISLINYGLVYDLVSG